MRVNKPVRGKRNRSGADPLHLARLGALLGAAGAASADAATITVNSTADNTTSGDTSCTLREALANANSDSDTSGGDCVAGSGADTIAFTVPAASTITLSGTQLTISDSVTVAGPGAAALTVSGNNASRIFYVYNNSRTLDVTISGVTLSNGNNVTGSAVFDHGENLTLSSVTASANTGDAVLANTGGALTVQASTLTGTTTGRGLRANHIASVAIDNTQITGNNSASKGAGVFLYQITGAATISNSTITGNTSANRAGGVFLYNMQGAVTISNSVISNNTAGSRGGGIVLYKPLADVQITDTTIAGNTSANRGGGIFFYKQAAGKTFTLTRTTISGNAAGASFGGGGIFFYKQAGANVIENSTISGNTANQGGAIYDEAIGGGTLDIHDSTIAGNTATTDGGNLRVLSFPSVALKNTIVADGIAATDPDLETSASNTQANFSLIEDTTGATLSAASTNNITGIDPQLGALQNNGGATFTRLIAATSPARDAGTATGIPATDQRGQSRNSGAAPDIGAVELNGGVIQFAAATVSINEGGGSVTINVTRSGGTDPASADYATAPGTATSPADFTAASGTVTFAAGATSASFVVPIIDDALYEGNETFTVALSNPSAIASLGAISTATVTIQDNEVAPSLSINDVTQNEGNSGTSTYGFTVTLSGAPSAVAVTVGYATADGSATVAGSDYVANGGTLTFAPGTTSQPVSVQVNGDTTIESNETFSVVLSGATNAGIGKATGTGTIVNDDAAASADLSITKAANGGAFSVGQTVDYTITVQNAGPDAATGVVATDVLPANTTFVSATPSQGSCAGTTTITCTLGTLNNGAGATIDLRVRPTVTGPLSNTASVTSGVADPNGANGSSTSTITVAAGAAVAATPALGDLARILLMVGIALLGAVGARRRPQL